MKKHITLFEKVFSFGDSHQELWDIDDRKRLYRVSDLSECPEDAIIGRALLSGEEVLDLVKLGMNYSKMGYDEIEYDYLECPKVMEKEVSDALVKCMVAGGKPFCPNVHLGADISVGDHWIH